MKNKIKTKIKAAWLFTAWVGTWDPRILSRPFAVKGFGGFCIYFTYKYPLKYPQQAQVTSPSDVVW